MTKRPMINEALRLLRHYCGLSQSELAVRLSVAQSMISDIEGGRKSVSMDLLQAYSSALNVRMSQLLFFAEEIEGEPVMRRGQLIIADRILRLLDQLKPTAHEPAQI